VPVALRKDAFGLSANLSNVTSNILPAPIFGMEFSNIFDLAAARSATLHEESTIAQPENIELALKALPTVLPETGFGTDAAIDFVIHKVLPGLASGQSGPRYVMCVDWHEWRIDDSGLGTLGS